MSLILGIDTSSTDLGIGLWSDGEALASCSRFVKNSHAETIADTVAMTLAGGGFKPGDVTHIAVACGPGSFTGLRIGVAFVKGYCFGAPTPVLPLSSLFILAHGGVTAAENGRVVAAIDARRDELFWARFSVTPTGISRLSDDCRSGVVEFTEALREGDTVITDTMGYGRSSVFTVLKKRQRLFPVERYPVQRGLVCAAAGARALAEGAIDGISWQEAAAVLPRYHRDFASPPAGPQA
jgi:tRNA threonylcarbamoyladenosine biosynthesis protein TsaB